MYNLTYSMSTTENVFWSAASIIQNIEAAMTTDPVFAVLGFVTALINLFNQPTMHDILNQLTDIQKQIAFLQ